MLCSVNSTRQYIYNDTTLKSFGMKCSTSENLYNNLLQSQLTYTYTLNYNNPEKENFLINFYENSEINLIGFYDHI